MVQIFVHVRDISVAEILDGPDVYQVCQERGIAKSSILEILTRGNIDDRRTRDFLPEDIIGFSFQAHEDAAR
jgi:hypothetical protein